MSTETQKGESNRRSQLLTGLAISTLTIVLILAGVELAGFFWERKTAQGASGWTLVASRRMPLVRHGSKESPYYLLEPGANYNWEGIPVHISPQGFRNDEFSVDKPVGTYRILNLGDSVVFGWEVLYEDTYGQRLERLLNDLDNGQRYQVINAGIPGWNLIMEHTFLVQEGLGCHPDAVVLGITLVNDILGKTPTVPQNPDLFDWLRDNTYTWPFISTQVHFLLAKKIGPQAIPVLNPPHNEEFYYPLHEDDPAWKRAWSTILEMQQLAQEQGAHFVLVVFPTAFQLNSVGHSDFPQRLIAKLAAGANMELVDMLPIYHEVCVDYGPAACEGYENMLFADVWMHPNTLGHKLAAEAIFELFAG